MPPRTRTPVKKTIRRNVTQNRQVVIKTEMVPVADLKPYYKNPRIGDPIKTAKSLHLNGQYKPIVVNVGTHTKRKNEILAGNHTWLGARKELHWSMRIDGKNIDFDKEPWTEMLVSWVDVDEDAAREIVMWDNKSGDDSTYDDELLAEIIKMGMDAGRAEPGGFELDEVDDIVGKAMKSADAAMKDVEDITAARTREEREERRSKSFDGVPLGEEEDAEFDDDEEADGGQYVGNDLEKSSDQLDGMFQFKPPENINFEGVGPWGIPKLKSELLMSFDDLPPGLDSWAGSATKDDDDPDRWWLYNYGVDSTSGMRDLSKVIMSFYCFDHYFDNWWWYPERYFAKMLNSKIQFMLTPNFSQPTELPKVDSLWNLYRARWIGRYGQECGIKVCPDITWRDGDSDWLEKQVLATLPKGLPLIAMQLQTIDEEKMSGTKQDFIDQVELVFAKLRPQGALIYTGKQGREMIKEMNTQGAKIRTLGTRMEKLSMQAKGRKKKTTI